jgi:hypothetical protein
MATADRVPVATGAVVPATGSARGANVADVEYSPEAIAQAQLSQHMAALRKAQLVACHACGTMRCYYILRPTLVKKLIPLLRREHPRQPRDHDAVIRAAKRGRQFAADREQSSTPG